MHDVQGAQVASFPKEEFPDVDQLQGNGDDHGIADEAVKLLLCGGIGEEQQGPSHHAESAIRKLFDIPSEEKGIEFRSPVVIE